jgi:uncharacterized membrane protein SirB2
MRDDAFPDAVTETLVPHVVPCLGLFSGIELLQLIDRGSREPRE